MRPQRRLQLIWGAILAVSLQTRSLELGPRVAFGVALLEFTLGAAFSWGLPRV